MSVLAITPVVLVVMYILVLLWSRLNEDQLVLFLFVGVPCFMGLSFVAMMSLYRQLYIQKFPVQSLATGGLLSFVFSFVLQEAFIYITSFYVWSEYTTKWIILISTWMMTICVSTALFLLIVQKRYLVNDINQSQ